MAARSISRSTDPASSDDLIVGLIIAPHGLRGDLRVDIRSDVPERFEPGARLLCDGIGELIVESAKPGPRGTLVHFRGYRDREAAEPLSKRFLRVTRDDARRATAGAYLWADLVGLRAYASDGTELGVVADLLRAGETDVLVIRGSERELLAPMLQSVVREIDLEAGRVVVAPQEELG